MAWMEKDCELKKLANFFSSFETVFWKNPTCYLSASRLVVHMAFEKITQI